MGNEVKRRLKRRFREFLAVQGDEATAAVRTSIRGVLDRLLDRKWRAYIVGGTLRDVMLAPTSAFPRDIDIVVSGESKEAVEGAFHDLVNRRTRFGGLHLVKPFSYGGISTSQGQVIFDVWRLEDTWGIRHAGLPPAIESFVQTPFLNIDSVAIELVPRQTRRQVAECGFFEALSSRMLEINYAPNPFPEVCIVRALIMGAKLNFSLGPSLAKYIADYSQRGSVDALVEAQISHYGRVRCPSDELRRWLDEIHAKITSGEERIEVCTTYERQLELWRSWPPIPNGDPPMFLTQTDEGAGTANRLGEPS